MRAITFDTPGDADVLRLAESPRPRLGEEDVRIQVKATAVNRADLLQRRGMYPPPKGASPVLGLECAGAIIEVGKRVKKWKVGARVMALLPGGGYAEEAVAHEGSVIAVPPFFSDEEAAAFPEAFITAYLNIFMLGEPPAGGRVLIHGGGSGVGTAAIKLCKEAELTTFVTAGSADKCARCEDLGAIAINYRDTPDFAAAIAERTAGAGVQTLLDCIGGAYLERNLKALAPDGRLVCIGLMGGSSATLDMGLLLARRLRVLGSTLRSRGVEEKAVIIQSLLGRFGQAISAGRLRPEIDMVLPLADAAQAHQRMEASSHFGKIALRVA
jgi:tumor protein p53-inducible protein 3